MADNQIVPRRHNDPKEEKIEEQDPSADSGRGMVVEETAENSVEPEVATEDPRESENGSVFGTRDFASNSFDQGGDSKKKIILILLVVLAGAGLIAGGFWVYNSKLKPAAITPTSSPQAPSPAPTPKVEVNVSQYKTRVLNGSGTPGKAGVIKDMLEKEGFKEVATANAKSFDYKETEVSIKASVPPAVFETIKKILPNYTVVQGDALEDDDDYDITIVVGSKSE